MRVLAWVGAAIMAVIVIVAIAAYVAIQRGALVGPAETMLSAALGRDVSLGRVNVRLGDPIDIELDDIRVANPDWAEAPEAARLDRIAISLHPWPLLKGDVRIERLVARGGTIDVEVAEDGRVNWASAETAGEVVAPEEREEFPAIETLEVADIDLRLTDRPRGMSGEVAVAAAISPADPRIVASMDGTLDQQPLRVAFAGDPPAKLRDEDAPYPFELDVAHGPTEAKIAGSATAPLAARTFDVTLTLSGPSLAEILPKLELPLPITPPYKLAGRLARDDDRWRFEEIDGTVGDSDLSGKVAVDLGGDKPVIVGDLRSRRLDFADLGGLVGAAPKNETASADQTQQRAETDGIFPDVPLDDERLQTANLEITLTADEVIAPNLPIRSLAGTFNLDDGRLLIRPLTFGTDGGGAITGEIALNAREATPSADADLTLQDVDLRPFFENTQFIQEMGGTFSGRLYMIGTGRSLADMMATANGTASLGMRDGRMSALIVEAAGLDVAEALLVVVTEDSPVPISCARADAEIVEGVVRLSQVIVDTSDSTLIAKGQANLREETLDMQIEARAKDFSLLDLAAPVQVSGSWRDPEIAIGGLDPLPFLEMGDQEDVDCAALLGNVTERAAAR